MKRLCTYSFPSLRGGADKSLARLTSLYRRTESIVSLERAVCSCAELQDFSCYRGWKEACQATRAISTKVTKGVLLLHDSASAHRALATQKKLAYLGFQCFDHPPYSSDLASSDYHLFPGLKKTIEMSPFFVRREGHCCRGDLVGRTSSECFWMACKS